MSKKEKEKFEEIKEYLSGEKDETIIVKKAMKDKITGQVSLKLPKNFCTARDIDENSEFEVILNPNKETWEELKEENLIIRIKKK